MSKNHHKFCKFLSPCGFKSTDPPRFMERKLVGKRVLMDAHGRSASCGEKLWARTRRKGSGARANGRMNGTSNERNNQQNAHQQKSKPLVFCCCRHHETRKHAKRRPFSLFFSSSSCFVCFFNGIWRGLDIQNTRASIPAKVSFLLDRFSSTQTKKKKKRRMAATYPLKCAENMPKSASRASVVGPKTLKTLVFFFFRLPSHRGASLAWIKTHEASASPRYFDDFFPWRGRRNRRENFPLPSASCNKKNTE